MRPITTRRDFWRQRATIFSSRDWLQLSGAPGSCAKSTTGTAAEPGTSGTPPVRAPITLNSTAGLYSILKDHMEKQFDLIDKVMKGEIDVATFDRLSTNATIGLETDLIGATAGLPSVAVTYAKHLIAQRVLAEDPTHNQLNPYYGSTPTVGFYPRDARSFQEFGSPGDDSFTDKSTSGDVFAGGKGNDYFYGHIGSDIISGGSGHDAITYGDVTGSMTIDLGTSAPFAQGTGFTDRLFSIEDASGTYSADTISGSSAGNWLGGLGGNDLLQGRSGNDTLNGDDGADTLNGGDGKDTAQYYSGIYDPVYMTYVGLTLSLADPSQNTGEAKDDVFIGIENLFGSDAGDKIYGDDNANALSGSHGKDVIFGNGGNDSLNGGDDSDKLNGGAGNDRLKGDAGNDVLRGGGGADQFRFTLKPNATNVDVITDFTHGEDKIAFEDRVFTALGSAITSNEFIAKLSGHAATSATQHLIYDKSNGQLWYDTNGSANGGASLVAQLGTTSAHPTNLTYSDFAIA